MRQQLIQYVDLLFAGAENCEEIKQEILQNTLDRYDDLIAEGKVPEAAYRLAITGIGDVNEILGSAPQPSSAAPRTMGAAVEPDTDKKKLMRAVAVGLYILCPIPLFILSELGLSTIGLCGLLTMVAVATAFMVLGAKQEPPEAAAETAELAPQQALKQSINKLIGVVGLVVYLLISFATGMWYITWLIFPIMGAIKGLASAIVDLKEAVKDEN